jgi:hypothetical protein
MRINVRSLRSAYQSTYQDNPPQHYSVEIWRMMNKVFKSVGFHNKSDPDLIGIRVREFPVESDRDQNTADSQNPTSRAASGKVAKPAAFVQTDKHGVRNTVPPLPQSALDDLLGSEEPERFLKWFNMRFILDTESEMQIQATSIGSAYQSTCQSTPPQLFVADVYNTMRKVIKNVVLLPRGADGRDYVFQGMRAREFPVKAGTDQAFQGRVSVSPETTGRRDLENDTWNQDAVAPRGVVNGSGSGTGGVSTGASESESDGSFVEGRLSGPQGRSLGEQEHVHTGVNVGDTSGAPVHAQVTSAKKRNPGMGKISPATDPRILGVAMATESTSPPGHQERTNEQYMAQINNVVNIVPRPPEYHMPQPNVPYVRPPE